MNFKEFASPTDLHEATASLLNDYFEAPTNDPYGVMLTGGNTVREIYHLLTMRNVHINQNLHILLSDERYAPISSPDSNYGFIKHLVKALDIDISRVIRPMTELPIDDCATRYHEDIEAFMQKGSIPLGILGLGADGHLASIFSTDDMNAGKGVLAQPVSRPEPPNRVSVTQDLLMKVKKLVFVTAGKSKYEIIKQLQSAPDTVVAGTVLKDAEDVTIWYCE